MSENIKLLFCILIGVVIGYLIAKIAFYIKLSKARKQTIKQSKAVLIGQATEKIAPLLPGFNYNFNDLVFIGKGIDYLVMDGLSSGKLNKIVFLEVKTGKSNLNTNEKQIKEIIAQNKVYYEVFKV